MVNQAKLRSYNTAPRYKYGFEVPRTYDQALRLDQKNGNTLWADQFAPDPKLPFDRGKPLFHYSHGSLLHCENQNSSKCCASMCCGEYNDPFAHSRILSHHNYDLMERFNTVDYMYGEPSKYHHHNAFIDPEDHTRQTPILDQQEYYQPFKSLTASLTLQADKEDSLSDYDTIISGERGVSIFTAFQSTQPCHVRYHYYQEGLFRSWYILALILGSFTLMMLSLLDRICDDFSIDIMKKPFEHTTKSTYFTTGTSLKKATKSSNHVLNVYSCNEAGITDGRSDVYGIKQAYFVFFDRFPGIKPDVIW
jgi:hypothetical protein